MRIIRIKGGLGNQMFQYAFARTMSIEFPNEKIVFDYKYFNNTLNRQYSLDNFEIFKSRNYLIETFLNVERVSNKYFGLPLYVQRVMEKEQDFFKYNPQYFNKDGEIKLYDGYWQCEKYFKRIKNQIKAMFSFPVMRDDLNKKNEREIRDSKSVSIHIRRGDYIDSFADNICNKDYFLKAITLIKGKINNPKFFIFSDGSTDEVYKIVDFLKFEEHEIIANNQEKDFIHDMHLMSICKHNIISNSSFSWWGAYLNSNINSIVIAPKYWTQKYDDTIQIQCKGWIRI